MSTVLENGVMRQMTAEELVEYNSIIDKYNSTAAVNARDNAVVIDEISALENTMSPRRIRDAALTQAGKDWMQAIEDQITALRANLL